MKSNFNTLRPSLVAATVASTLALCSTSAFAAQSLVKGVVGGAYFAAPVVADTAAASVASSTAAGVYQGAKVCFDLNDNGVCDSGEPFTMTAVDGSFTLLSKTLAPLVAEISTTTLNNGHAITSRNVFRAKADQIAAATHSPMLPAAVDITPLSTEVARAVENDGVSYTQAVNNLAQRINVSPQDVLTAPSKITDATELPAILKESVIDTGRFELAAKFVDRGDNVGVLRGNFDCPNVASFDAANADVCPASDQQTVGIKAAQNYAMNLEGMPRYDYVFVIIEENESLVSLKNAAGIPYLNALLNNGSQFYNYYSTGSPSEPNYLALGSADDWGISGDEPANLPYPSVTGVRANMSTAVDAKGLTWRHYEGSLWPSPAGSMANPGQTSWNAKTGGAFFDNPANTSIVGNDGATYSGGLVAKKHNTVSWFADVTAQSNFLSGERTISGVASSTDVNGNLIPYAFGSTSYGTPPVTSGNWDNALQSYATTHNVTSWWTGNTQPWTQDQFLQDLKAGDVANYNIIVPDVKDDMHDTGVTSRADYWANNVVGKIQSSSIWKDPTKRVAIIVTFDEGESATTACCGWNPKRSGNGASQVLAVDANGAVSATAPVSGTSAWVGNGSQAFTYGPTGTQVLPYSNGNHGHGVTLFGVLTNQQVLNNAPHGHYDTDYYSHFSFVRTMQDVLGLSDPGQPGTYMNRSKYTENFIQQNATLLPEFANSASPHFDSVRAMNHVYQFPAGVQRVPAAGTPALPVTTGPDADQVNLFAVK